MVHGKKFINEHSQYYQVLYKLYKTRDLDEWYVQKCRKRFELPGEFSTIKNVKKIKVQDNFLPSVHVYLELKEVSDNHSFSLFQEIQIVVSKIIPVYYINYVYKIKHHLVVGELGLGGAPQTFEMMEASDDVIEVMDKQGFIALDSEYDLKDTVFEWDELEGIDPVNRRLTLEDAVFTDILDLCD